MTSTWILLFLCATRALGAERNLVGRLPRQPEKLSSLNIYGGNKTSISKYPFTASLSVEGSEYGAAVILNDNWLLTTGYAVYGYTVDELSFRVGSSFYDKQGQVLKASQVIIHPKYPGNGWDYDIAVVQTTKPIKFGKNVQPIQALGTKKLKAGTKGMTAGWGYYDSSYQVSENLLEAQVTVYNWKKCKEVYGEYLNKRLMCTYDKDESGCPYDYGDPFVDGGVLYGLYAGGYDCDPGSDPILFTDVTSLYKWVEKTINATESVQE